MNARRRNCHYEHYLAKYKKIKQNARLMGQLKLVHFKETKELTFSRDRKSYCVSKNKLPNQHSAWFYLLLNIADPKVYITFWLDFTAVSPRGPSITESVFQPPPPPHPIPLFPAGHTGIATSFIYRKMPMTCTDFPKLVHKKN